MCSTGVVTKIIRVIFVLKINGVIIKSRQVAMAYFDKILI